MKSASKEAESYFAELPSERKAALGAIRSLIFESIPGIRETMRYRMPTYELDQVICAIASQKHYISLYMDTNLVEEHKSELDHLDVGKSCIRFKKLDDLPIQVIRRILVETVHRQGGLV